MVEVEEDEAVRRVEVLHALDEVVLEAQQPQARLGLENGDSWKRKRAERVTGGLRVRNGLPYRAVSTFIFIQVCYTPTKPKCTLFHFESQALLQITLTCLDRS